MRKGVGKGRGNGMTVWSDLLIDTRHCDFWTSGTDRQKEGEWRWLSTGETLAYHNWNIGEPNNGSHDEHCLNLMWVFNWAWNDARCNADNACYICETSP